MKKLILFSVWVVSCVGFLYLMNCSKPLDSIVKYGQTDSDTVFAVDTIIVVDSTYCARLNSQRQEIVWILFNQEGLFHLEFEAITERDNDSRTLVIDLNDQQYIWPLAEYHGFILEQNLEQNTHVRIVSDPPHAYGQAIDICLSVRAL